MNRENENKEIIEHFIKAAKEKQAGTFEEVALFNLGVIATVLSDISKSLAIIADNVEAKDSRLEREAAGGRNGQDYN